MARSGLVGYGRGGWGCPPGTTVVGKAPQIGVAHGLTPTCGARYFLEMAAQMRQPHQRLIGFAAQTGDIVTPAREKLERKGLDLIVANAVDQVDCGFGTVENAAVVLDRRGRSRSLAKAPKLILAHQIFDLAQEWLT